ncbi:unnamed protein product [Brachionus calyciflorus]|uniref:Ig-like domain-containing protein n=1 Tax=Brachionus calyciflorus TaxID=104777 RepID=A0A813WRP0_9BILA|nr:unnamed protein product [Brachionus calyciflorus]
MSKNSLILIFNVLILINFPNGFDFSEHVRSHHRSNRFKLINQQKRTLQNELNLMSSKSESNLQRDYIAATLGKDVQLDCKMSGLVGDDEKIVWLKMPKGEVLTLNSNRVTSDSRISTKCSSNINPCWSLIITDVRESDTGFYVCQTNAMQNKYVYLDIMVAPKLLTQYPLERIDVNQSSHFTLTCEFYGKPEPLIKWFKYQHGVQKEIEKYRGSNKINLLIHKESPNEYECVADNSIPPTVSKKIYLNIQYPPQIKFLNNKLFQKKGERVIFDCKVNSNPKSEILWFKNDTRIVESSKYTTENLDDSYNRLYINNLTNSDFTDYYCLAVNLLGKASAKTELVELRTVSLTDPAKIFTTKISTSTELVKLSQTVNQQIDKTSMIVDELAEGTTTKNRIFKGTNDRSNKNSNKSKLLKNNQKQHVQNQFRNQQQHRYSTTKFLITENSSFSHRTSRELNIFLILLCTILFKILF